LSPQNCLSYFCWFISENCKCSIGFHVECGFQSYVGNTKFLSWYKKDTIVNMKCNNSSFARVCPFFALTGWNSTGCPKKHGNSVTNWISSLLWISIVIPDFTSHNIIMSARVYFMKKVKDCKDVSIMSPQDEQGRRTSLLCLYTAIFLFY